MSPTHLDDPSCTPASALHQLLTGWLLTWITTNHAPGFIQYAVQFMPYAVPWFWKGLHGLQRHIYWGAVPQLYVHAAVMKNCNPVYVEISTITPLACLG